MYPSSNLTGEASIHHYGNFSYLAEFSIDGLKINEKKKSMSQTLLYEIFNYCLFSHSVVFNSLWPHWLQHTTLCRPSPSPRDCSNACPLVNDAIQPFHPLGLLLPLAMIFPSIRVFSNESAVCIRCSKYWNFRFSISASNEYSGLVSFRIWLVWSPSHPKDSRESSPAPQFKSINSLAVNLLYSPTLTSVHDY